MGILLGIAIGLAAGWGIFRGNEGGTKSSSERSGTGGGRQVRISERDGVTRLERSRGGVERVSSGGEERVVSILENLKALRFSGNETVDELELGRLGAEIGTLSADEAESFLVVLESLRENEDLEEDPLGRVSQMAMLRLFEIDGLTAMTDLGEGKKYPNLTEHWGEEIAVNGMATWTRENPKEVKDWVMAGLHRMEAEEDHLLSHQFLENEEVGYAFMMGYERQVPGGTERLISEFKTEEGREDMKGISLIARVRVSEEGKDMGVFLNEAKELGTYDAREVLEVAITKDVEATADWVGQAEDSPFRNRAVIDVAEEMMESPFVGAERGLQWLFDQKLSDPETRKRRLAVMVSEFRELEPPIWNPHFNVPADTGGAARLNDLPAVDVVWENTRVGEQAVDINSINAILNNPNRTVKENPAIFVEELRKTAAGQFEGRYSEFIEQEIQALGLEVGK